MYDQKHVPKTDNKNKDIFMGDHCTFLVDTFISQSNAIRTAPGILAKLINDQIIDTEGLTTICSSSVFPFHPTFIEASPASVSSLFSHSHYSGMMISVRGYDWVADSTTGHYHLAASEKSTNGLFMNYDGGFHLECPHCHSKSSFGWPVEEDSSRSEDDIAAREDKISSALGIWHDQGISHLKCPDCQTIAAIQNWQTNSFAAGYLAVTLWGRQFTLQELESDFSWLLDLLNPNQDRNRIAVVGCMI